jgi:hypothetical protein
MHTECEIRRESTMQDQQAAIAGYDHLPWVPVHENEQARTGWGPARTGVSSLPRQTHQDGIVWAQPDERSAD